jgi:hypothetical protein
MNRDLSPMRPLTQDTVEIIHWFAARGFSPGRIARQVKRPTRVVRQVLQETTPPPPVEPDWWPRREAATRGRLPSYMTVIKQRLRGTSA